MQSSNYTCEVASYTREVASSKLYNSFLSHIRCLCKTSNPFFHSCIVFSFFCTAKARILKRNDDPTKKDSSIQICRNLSLLYVSALHPFFLSSRIIFSSASLSYDPTILCFSSLPYISGIFFLQNREVLKSALSEFSIAINQAFVNLTQKLCQGVQ